MIKAYCSFHYMDGKVLEFKTIDYCYPASTCIISYSKSEETINRYIKVGYDKEGYLSYNCKHDLPMWVIKKLGSEFGIRNKFINLK